MQIYNLVRPLCHFCRRLCSLDTSIPCKTPSCGKLFCHKCLTSRYKYSKAKVSRLPTPNWKCPYCTKRCACDDCIGELGAPLKRGRTGKYKVNKYRYKKLKTSIRRVVKCYSRTDANTKAPLDDKGSHKICTPILNWRLPSISRNLYYNY